LSEAEPLPDETIALIVRARGGDRPALEALIGSCRQRIARFVIAQTGDAANYEDLCQAIFVKMVVALPRLRTPERFQPWLFQIARNVCRDHARARTGWRRLFVALESGHDAASPEPEADHGERIERGMEQLPDSQQTVLRLSLDGRTTYEELAQMTDSSVSAVKSRLHRARENLRASMLAGDSE
jgi:RNA polymerase sigma-70 factor (ECF subfamily)